MSETLKANSENGPTPVNKWDFVKDKNAPVLANGGPNSTNSPQLFSEHNLASLLNDDTPSVIEDYQKHPDKIRELISSLVGDKNDTEKINYYMEHPDSAVHDLLEVPEQFKERAEKGELTEEQILHQNEAKYDELRDRLYAIEQSYPQITEKNFYLNEDIPHGIRREWVLGKRYMKLLASPISSISRKANANDKYSVIEDSNNEAIGIVKDSDAATSKTISDELEQLSRQNQQCIKEPEQEQHTENIHAVLAKWQSNLAQVQDIDSYHKLEKTIRKQTTPGESPYGLRAISILNDKINQPLQEKYKELRAEEIQHDMQGLDEKYKDQNNALKGNDLASLRSEHDNLVQELANREKTISDDETHLRDLRELLDEIPAIRRRLSREARRLKQEIETQERELTNNTERRNETHQRIGLINDQIRYLELADELKQL